MADLVVQEPVILLVGAGPALEDALVEAVMRHGICVEAVSSDMALEATVVAAPDLVVLAGEAARNGGIAVLSQLAASPVSSVVPVVVLGESLSPDQRLEAFREGAAAVLARSQSVEATAGQLAQLAIELPERTSKTFDELGKPMLRDFADALSQHLRDPLLVPESARSEADGRLVFGGGRPLARLVDEFVQRLEHPMVDPEAVARDPMGVGPLQRSLLGEATQGEPSNAASLAQLRVALVDDEVPRADAVAQDLRARGAIVLVIEPVPSEPYFAQLRRLCPSVLVMGDSHVRTVGRDLVARVHADWRLRWATLLVVEWARISPEPGRPSTLDQLAGRLAALAGAEHDVQRRLHQGFTFDTRLESTGPTRLLYALAEGLAPLRVTVQAPRARVELELSEGLVVGATATRSGVAKSLEGPAALATLLALSSARVRIAPAIQPATANLMATVDMSLDLAERGPEAGRVRPASVSPDPGPPASIDALAAAPAQAGAGSEARPLEPERDSVAGPPAAGSAEGAGAPAAGSADGGRPSAARSEAQDTLVDPPKVRQQEDPRRPGVNRADDVGARGPGSERQTEAAAGAERHRFETRVLGAAVGLALIVVAAIVLVALRRPRPAAVVSLDSARVQVATSEVRTNGPPTTTPSAVASPSPGESSDAGLGPEPVVLPAATNPTTPSCQQLLKTDEAQARRDTPAWSHAAMRRGRRALVRGDVREAQRAYCRAVRSDPSNAGAQAELARLLLIRRDARAGLVQVRTALEVGPTNRVLQGLLGDALARLGRYEEARHAWLTEARLDGSSDESDRALAKISLGTARRHRFRHAWGEAERFYRRVVVLEPSNVEASLGLAQALRGLKVFDEARAWTSYAERLQMQPPEAAAVARDPGVGP